MGKAWDRVRALWAELDDLERAAAVLEWDQLVHMPAAGAGARGVQLATLRRLAHERLTGPAMAEALAAATADPDADPVWLRAARRRFDREARVPADLVEARSRAGTRGYMAWLEARASRRFAPFAPALEEVLGLARQYADAIGWEGERYDALLGGHEPGLRTDRLRALFAELTQALPSLLEAIRTRPAPPEAFRRPVPAELQLALGREAVGAIGYDLARGRIDLSVHPFSTSFGPDDCRITTRVDPDDFAVSFFALLHEAGHALYEQGIPASFARGPLGGGASTGVHESQSRLWENGVGRSAAFWEWFAPQLAARVPAFSDLTPELAWRAANRVQPGPIRVLADEVTYNLHIALRFELEVALVRGDLPVQELPAAWDAGMERLLGLRPRDHLEGVLQDIHWSDGSFGYFPSYTLGNLLAAMWLEAAAAALGDLEADWRRGAFAPLLGFLRRSIHARGAGPTPEELAETVAGRPIHAAPFLAYLRRKYAAVYGL
jgi:carboxypeptidase Taq